MPIIIISGTSSYKLIFKIKYKDISQAFPSVSYLNIINFIYGKNTKTFYKFKALIFSSDYKRCDIRVSAGSYTSLKADKPVQSNIRPL